MLGNEEESSLRVPLAERLLRRLIWLPLSWLATALGVIFLPIAIIAELVRFLVTATRRRTRAYGYVEVDYSPLGLLEREGRIVDDLRPNSGLTWLGGGLVLAGTWLAASNWSDLAGYVGHIWSAVRVWMPALIVGLGLLVLAVSMLKNGQHRRRLTAIDEIRRQLTPSSQPKVLPPAPLPGWVVVLAAAIVIAVGAVTLLLLLREADLASPTERAGLRLDAIKTALIVSGTTSGIQALLLGARRYWLYERGQAYRELVTATQEAYERATRDLDKALAQLSGETDLMTKIFGLRTLERVGQENPDLRETVVLVLADYIASAEEPVYQVHPRTEWRVELENPRAEPRAGSESPPAESPVPSTYARVAQRARSILRSHYPFRTNMFHDEWQRSTAGDRLWHQVREPAWPAEFRYEEPIFTEFPHRETVSVEEDELPS